MNSGVYVALGSNLGSRTQTLERAVDEMVRAGLIVSARSGWIETAPVGGPDGQGPYLNGVVELETDLPARELLARLQQIEHCLGRDRSKETRWGPRTCDLDIILYGAEIIESDDLTIPHPRMQQRGFVLEPLCQIAPDAVDPRSGKTVSQLLKELESTGRGER